MDIFPDKEIILVLKRHIDNVDIHTALPTDTKPDQDEAYKRKGRSLVGDQVCTCHNLYYNYKKLKKTC